jgi:hypothetical protein
MYYIEINKNFCASSWKSTKVVSAGLCLEAVQLRSQINHYEYGAVVD